MPARIHLALWCILTMAACTPEQRPQQPSSDGLRADTARRYPIRSVRLVSTSSRPGQARPDTSIFMFDDYGRLERSEQVVEVPVRDALPVRVRTVVIRNGRTIYNLDVQRRTYRTSVMQVGAGGERFVDFMGLSDAELETFHVKRRGKATVMNRECTVFAVDDPEHDVYGSYMVWMNVPLQMDVAIRGARMTTRPLELEENLTIDTALFAVPTGYRPMPEP